MTFIIVLHRTMRLCATMWCKVSLLFFLVAFLSLAACSGYRYLSIDISEPGTLGEHIDSKISSLSHINISGKLNEKDLSYIENIVNTSDVLSIINLEHCNVTLPHHFFAGCKYLKKITLPHNAAISIPHHLASGCPLLQHIDIPDGCEQIEEEAFSYCTALSEIYLPESLQNIRSKAFYHSGTLGKVVCASQYPPACSADAFQGISPQCVLIVPKGAKSRYRNAPGWEIFSTIEEIKKIDRETGKTQWRKNF